MMGGRIWGPKRGRKHSFKIESRGEEGTEKKNGVQSNDSQKNVITENARKENGKEVERSKALGIL